MNRVHHTDAGFGGLSEPEQLYFAVNLLEREVYNGGFDQYFHNSSSDYYALVLHGLDRIGATQTLELLRRAKQILFADAIVPEDRGERWELRRATVDDDEVHVQLNMLDRAYCKDPDGMNARLQAFALQHGLVRAKQ